MRPVCQLMIFPHSITLCPRTQSKEKIINLIEWTFKREGSPNIAFNERQAFSLLETQNDINFGRVKTCVKP